MKPILKVAIVLVLFVLPLAHVAAEPSAPDPVYVAEANSCPDIVERAWNSLDEACLDGVRNTACYGHILLDATPQDFVTSFEFDAVGDRASLTDLQSLQLSSMNVSEGSWGVAMLTVQANLPASDPAQNVALLMFGDVQIDNTRSITPIVDVYADAGGYNANIRQLPQPTATVIGSIPVGGMTTATGRTADNEWLRVQVPGEAATGWVSTSIVSFAAEDDLTMLDIAAPAQPYYGPMQAFYFESAADDRECPEAPNSGILIQTPEGVAEVTLLINEVDISIGSTVYFQAQSGGEFRVSVIEGHADVTTNGVTSRAFTGTEVTVQLDANGAPVGSPALPKPYSLDNLQGLPVDHLPDPVTIGAPLTQAEIDVLLVDLGGGTGDDDDGDDDGDDDTGDDDDSNVKVLVCHNGNTLEISIEALDSHLAHGDTEGACPEGTEPPGANPPGGGKPDDTPGGNPHGDD